MRVLVTEDDEILATVVAAGLRREGMAVDVALDGAAALERPARRDGHGLGLSIVRAIAIAHAATITARPRPGGGLTIDVTFPP